MPVVLDLTGQRFGKLVAECLVPKNGRERKWRCWCDCGTVVEITVGNLRSGNSKACGQCRTPTYGGHKHGHTSEVWRSPTYYSWRAMKRRCNDSDRDGAKYYVGRSIKYDPRWEDFAAFLTDMGERPDGLTLDRRDNDQGYFKDNCRWTTPTEQTRNRRNTRYVTREGQTLPLVVRAGELGIAYGTLYARLWRAKQRALSI